VVGTDLPYSSGALQRHPRSSPMHVVSCPHSPQVRSQVFSTSQRFSHRPNSTALFRAATVPGLPPFRVFPSRRSCTPLGATGSLAVIHRAAERTTSDLITRGFTDAHAFDAVAWIPHGLQASFPRVRRPASRLPWVTSGGIAPTASFTCFEAFFPPRVRLHRPGLPRAWRPLLSWRYAPLKTKPPKPRILRPA